MKIANTSGSNILESRERYEIFDDLIPQPLLLRREGEQITPILKYYLTSLPLLPGEGSRVRSWVKTISNKLIP